MFKLLSGFVAFILAIAIFAFLSGYFVSNSVETTPEVTQQGSIHQ
tara:strand:- start:1307 stop:1441 length:135 start_codon:yes stop_codon:yes gene_type:complete